MNNLSEEEKNAIEKLKKLKDFKQTFYGNAWFQVDIWADDEMKQTIDTVISLINNLQKEIEKLKRVKEPSGEFFMSKNGVVIKIIDNRKGDE